MRRFFRLPRRARRAADGHVIISGTGRAGTTFLVQYFTALGLDTGYTMDEVFEKPDPVSNAGLERSLGCADLPYIVKSPWFADQIANFLQSGRLQIAEAIIPMRDLYAAAESRRRVYQEVAALGKDPLKYPGTIWKTENPEEQELYLAMQFYKLIGPLVAHGIPIRFLHFPEFVHDHEALFAGLEPLLDQHGVSWRSSLSAYERVVNVALIHRFEPKKE